MRYHRRKDGSLNKCATAFGSCRVAPSVDHWTNKESALNSMANRIPSIEDKAAVGRYTSKLNPKKSGSGICFWCQNPAAGGVMNSHTVPRALLQQLTSDGMVLTSHCFLPSIGNLEISHSGDKAIVGVESSAMIFRLLCTSCDSVFATYENNYENHEWKPTQRELKEIALKNMLFRKSEWARWASLHSAVQSDNKKDKSSEIMSVVKSIIAHRSLMAPQPNTMIALDARIEASRVWLNDKSERFTVLHFEELPWVSPIVGQGEFLWDLNYGIGMSPTVHVAVFPSAKKNNTKVLVFSDDDRFIKAWPENIRNEKTVKQWISGLSDHNDEAFLWSPYLRKEMLSSGLTETNYLSQNNSLNLKSLKKPLKTASLLKKRDSIVFFGSKKRDMSSTQDLQAFNFIADVILNPEAYKNSFIGKVIHPPDGAKKHTKSGNKMIKTNLSQYLSFSDHPKFTEESLLDDLYGVDIDWSLSVEAIEDQLYKKYNLTVEEIAEITKVTSKSKL